MTARQEWSSRASSQSKRSAWWNRSGGASAIWPRFGVDPEGDVALLGEQLHQLPPAAAQIDDRQVGVLESSEQIEVVVALTQPDLSRTPAVVVLEGPVEQIEVRSGVGERATSGRGVAHPFGSAGAGGVRTRRTRSRYRRSCGRALRHRLAQADGVAQLTDLTGETGP